MPSRENSKEPEKDVGDASSKPQEEEVQRDAEVVQEPAATGSTDEAAAADSSNAGPPPSRRPQTRSQTGTVSKRRARDDADHVVENKKRAPVARKRQKVTTSAPPNDSNSSHTQGSSSPKPPPTRELSESSSTSSAALPATHTQQLTFYHSSLSEDQSECRLPRSRASLPTPIPNLTKKSRGRRVPTKDAGIAEPDQKDSRLYVCTVEGCGKCFHRGEHLKRHIRSIHTHEKPFKCTYPQCEKFFNRHDNLLQHLKVHRQANSLPDHPPTVPKRSLDEERYSPSSSHRHHRRQRSYSPADDDDEPESPVQPVAPPVLTGPRTIYNAHTFPTTAYNGGYAAPAPVVYPTNINTTHSHGSSGMGSNEPINIITNMSVSSLRTEVSSLRTEIPNSPVAMRLQASPY